MRYLLSQHLPAQIYQHRYQNKVQNTPKINNKDIRTTSTARCQLRTQLQTAHHQLPQRNCLLEKDTKITSNNI